MTITRPNQRSTPHLPDGDPAADGRGTRRLAPGKFDWLKPLAILCCLIGTLSADTFGFFTYTNNNTSITITDYPTTAVGPVEIPASIVGKPVTSIGYSAFRDCSGLTSVTIPVGVTSIGDSAFYNCTGLTTMSIPASVTSILGYAFYACSGLTSVTIPVGVKSIGTSAFYGCVGLTSVTIPVGVTSIGIGLFYYCSGLTCVTIPAGVTTIGNSAFYGCWKLKAVDLPSSVTSIEAYAFCYCTGLNSIAIPGGVTSITTYAFYHCIGLTSLTIPGGVTSIGTYAFNGCSALSQLVFLGYAPAVGANAFVGTNSGFTVYYLNGTKGFTSPTWNGYPSVNMESLSPTSIWLLSNGISATANLQADPNGDGVNLLMAYALNLDPRQNLSGSVPLPAFATNQMSLTFYAGSAGVTYAVESCTDMASWTTDGVIISSPDANKFRTATVTRTGPNRFMRLAVSN